MLVIIWRRFFRVAVVRLLNAWCELRDHHPSKSAKASRGRPSCSLSQMQKLCKATLAAKRAPELRFSATVGEEPEIELALV